MRRSCNVNARHRAEALAVASGDHVADCSENHHHVVMTELLTDAQINEALDHLPEWTQQETKLIRTVQFGSFPQAVQALNRVAEIAEQENHHPDIDVRHRTLTFACVTHSEGGITQADVSMAQEIDSTVEALTT